MSFESFYGGRMGASFIIVKRFDAITVEEGSKYKQKQLAVNSDGLYYVKAEINPAGVTVYNFIERNSDNYNDYIWKWTELDGINRDTIDIDTGVISQNDPGIAYLEGMVECFRKGGESTDIVNYGEYVIIDTPVKEDPDNGKVYRRGMNYDYNADTNPLAGAEYIGQVSGPRGATPEVMIDHYNTIIDDYGSKASPREYNVSPDEDIVPGSWEEGGDRKFEDKIKYVYATMTDELGNVTGCEIGFKITTLVQDFEGTSMSPYENRRKNSSGEYYNYDLITEDESEYIDGKWKHPFYQKWQVKVPHGYHGINSTNVEIIHTHTMPKDFKEGYAGAAVYYDAECTDPYYEGSEPLVLTDSVELIRGARYDASDDVISALINYNGLELYVKKEDCYMDVVRYKETNFDDLEEGEETYIEVGDYNIIERMTISKEGILTVYYSAEPDPHILDGAVLRWIDNDKGININDEGTITIYYNTLHDDGSGTLVNDTQVFPNIMKWIDNVKIRTTDASGKEGSGDQRMLITYNVPDPSDPSKKLVDALDNPINYIIESKISIPNQAYPNVPYWHLLVYYSDPALRASLSDKWVRYPSDKYPGTIWDEWVDLGSCKGELAGIHVLKNVTDMNDLKDAGGNWIPPEMLPDSHGVILNPEGAGWSCTLQEPGTSLTVYLFYDYDSKVWYKGTAVDPSAVDPSYVITKSEPGPDQRPRSGEAATLKENGFWFAVEKGIAVM